ncbi:MAG: DNA recombination protein RmuC [Flavobacterium sp.]|nr:DNA recombination protein RmuC [Flavobacterium sp.]
METIILIIICVLSLVVITLIIVFRNKTGNEFPELQNKIVALQSSLSKIEINLKDDFRINREENATIAKDNRAELNATLKDFKKELSETLKNITEQDQNALKEINTTLANKIELLTLKLDENNKTNRETLTTNLKDFNTDQRIKFDELKKEQTDLTIKTVEQLEKIAIKVEGKLNVLNQQAKDDAALMRETLANSFRGFGETFDKNIVSFNEVQKSKFEELEKKQTELINNTANKLESIRVTVEEKLEKTLSERLGQSFETVGKQLVEVQKGLGEMQTIAADVGGLKKVLSNVKLRGGVGEVQLAMLLEQILAPNQYEANVKTKNGSNDSVEFAIKLPGRSEDENNFVFLPIDAKFPKDTYEHLINAYENAIPDDIEQATKKLEVTIRNMAKDISEKYIDPPNTTDFAIMFLPFESIYAEVIRRSALIDQLRDKYKITVAGPTTLMAILNSLQMGFRTLSLQKRSSEVWKVLSSVKKEFENFGGLLDKAQKNIQTGLGQLDDLVGTRTKAIQRQLKNIETNPQLKTNNVSPEIITDTLQEIIENEHI